MTFRIDFKYPIAASQKTDRIELFVTNPVFEKVVGRQKACVIGLTLHFGRAPDRITAAL